MADNPKTGSLPEDQVNSSGLGRRGSDRTGFDPNTSSIDKTVVDPSPPLPAPASAASRAANDPKRMLAPKPAAATITLPTGFRLFEYRIDSVLGQGGFGIAYAATDVNLASKVVIKEHLPEEFAYRALDNSASARDDMDQ